MMDLQTRYRSLTNRERQVFTLVADGYLNKQIAAELGTSQKTVKIHRGQVMVKMRFRRWRVLPHADDNQGSVVSGGGPFCQDSGDTG